MIAPRCNADSCTSPQYLLEPFHSANVLNQMRQPIWKAESLYLEPIVLATLKCQGVRISGLAYNCAEKSQPTQCGYFPVPKIVPLAVWVTKYGDRTSRFGA